MRKRCLPVKRGNAPSPHNTLCYPLHCFPIAVQGNAGTDRKVRGLANAAFQLLLNR